MNRRAMKEKSRELQETESIVTLLLEDVRQIIRDAGYHR